MWGAYRFDEYSPRRNYRVMDAGRLPHEAARRLERVLLSWRRGCGPEDRLLFQDQRHGARFFRQEGTLEGDHGGFGNSAPSGRRHFVYELVRETVGAGFISGEQHCHTCVVLSPPGL